MDQKYAGGGVPLASHEMSKLSPRNPANFGRGGVTMDGAAAGAKENFRENTGIRTVSFVRCSSYVKTRDMPNPVSVSSIAMCEGQFK